LISGEGEDEDQSVSAQLKQIKGSFEGLTNSIKDGHNAIKDGLDIIIHKLANLGLHLVCIFVLLHNSTGRQTATLLHIKKVLDKQAL